MSNIKTNNAFKASLQSKIEAESVTASVIGSQMQKSGNLEQSAFSKALKGCVTRSKWFSIYENLSDKALKFCRENGFFDTLLDGKNAYETAICFAVVEACAHKDASRLVNRQDGFFTASPYSFYVNACKVKDFANLTNRPESKRLLLWKVNKGGSKLAIGSLFELDASGKNVCHDGSTQADYVLRVLQKLGSIEKIGTGSEAFFRWNKSSVVTKALIELAE